MSTHYLYYAASCALFSLRHSHGNDLIAVPSVDFEIGVECNYVCRTVNLGKPDKASVGQSHGPASVSAHQHSQVCLLPFDGDRDPNHSSLQQSKERIRIAALAP